MWSMSAMEDWFWGICLPPDRKGDPVQRPGQTFLAGGGMQVRHSDYEPEYIPPLRSAEWKDSHERLRTRFIHHKLFSGSATEIRVLHPDECELIEAAKIIWNGDGPQPDEGPAPRAWKWEPRQFTWWILELPPGLEFDQVRHMIREQWRRHSMHDREG